MKAGHLNTQNKQVDWLYNHWNDINKDFIKISLRITKKDCISRSCTQLNSHIKKKWHYYLYIKTCRKKCYLTTHEQQYRKCINQEPYSISHFSLSVRARQSLRRMIGVTLDDPKKQTVTTMSWFKRKMNTFFSSSNFLILFQNLKCNEKQRIQVHNTRAA